MISISESGYIRASLNNAGGLPPIWRSQWPNRRPMQIRVSRATSDNYDLDARIWVYNGVIE